MWSSLPRPAWWVAANLLLLASCRGEGTVAPLSPWLAVDSITSAAVASAAIPGLGLTIYDADDRVAFSRMYGDFAPDRRVAVASASKLVAGLVLFEVIDRGLLDVESTTADVLGWGGEPRHVTLRHLLAFTSGLDPGTPCTYAVATTLAECVDVIRGIAMAAGLGAEFDYGSSHLHVAARMAEVATGKSWNDLFREILGDPLGLPTDVRFYTAPRLALGTTNPLVAGGLRASMHDYAKMLALVYHRGEHDGVSVGNTGLFELQRFDSYPDALIRSSPMANAGWPFRYGLTAWLECATPATGCARISSPGAFGFTPWLDRSKGYYAIIGTELAGADGGVAAFSVALQQALIPAIEDALARISR